MQIIAAGLDNPRVDDHLKAELYKLLAQYYIGLISDFEKGEEFKATNQTQRDSMRAMRALPEDEREALLARWGEALAAVLPSVEAGDTLTAEISMADGSKAMR